MNLLSRGWCRPRALVNITVGTQLNFREGPSRAHKDYKSGVERHRIPAEGCTDLEPAALLRPGPADAEGARRSFTGELRRWSLAAIRDES